MTNLDKQIKKAILLAFEYVGTTEITESELIMRACNYLALDINLHMDFSEKKMAIKNRIKDILITSNDYNYSTEPRVSLKTK